MWFSLVVLFSAVAVHARVSFSKSEVLDNVDLQGTNKAAFRCSSGCRIYSPTKADKIVVVDAAGNKITTLSILSAMDSDVETFDLPAGSYELKNVGPANPRFIFYAVEKDAPNFDTKVFYLQNKIFGHEANQNYTLLSASGFVSLDTFIGFAPGDSLPIVYAAGFDSVSKCRPVYTASTLASLYMTEFTINSPIATVTFSKPASGSAWIFASGTPITFDQLTESDVSAVYTSPGFVGCPVVGDALYSVPVDVTSINVDSTFWREDGPLKLSINGDYSIAKQADALAIAINDDAMKLYGKSSISKSYNASKFDVKLAWKKNELSKDAFAVQIDIAVTGHSS